MRGALAGDGQDDMRIDGGEGDIDDFKLPLRILFPQQHLQITRGREAGGGIAHRGGLAQDKNTERAGRLVNRKPDRIRTAHDLPGEKPKSEILVLHVAILAADVDALEKLRIVTITAKPQGDLQQAE